MACPFVSPPCQCIIVFHDKSCWTGTCQKIEEKYAALLIRSDRVPAVQVLESSQNPWNGISSGTWAMLRQPLCIVLLRSADVAAEGSYPHGPRLFVAILTRTPLRYSLKAELGAFFPLLLHKPLQMAAPPPATLTACLEASAALAANSQLLVDLFVNYDCNLKAVNVVERWLAGLRRVAAATEVEAVRISAVSCVCTMLCGLAEWVAALQEGAPGSLQGGGDGGDMTQRIEEEHKNFEVCTCSQPACIGCFRM
jgi:hypothetical protein